MGRLDGKSALVTGAATGIGQAVAIRFAQEGARIAINYRAKREAAEAVASIITAAGGHCICVGGDVADEAQVKTMFAETVAQFGSLDVVVNNAGTQKVSATEEIGIQDFDRVLGVNLRGAFLCAREAARQFLKQGRGGVILNNSSVQTIFACGGLTLYSGFRSAWSSGE